MDTKFFTNRRGNTLYSKIKNLYDNNTNLDCFDAIVGYLRASGYFKVRDLLKDKHVRILIGIDTDKYIIKAHQLGLKYTNPNEAKEDMILNIKDDVETAEYTKEVEEGMLAFVQDISQRKLQVRLHPSKKIHAKMYIIYPEGFNLNTLTCGVITGSSNLTARGLGLERDGENQYEFNVLLTAPEDVDFAKNEFEELWKEAVEILPEDIQRVRKETYLVDTATPYEIYIKMLIEYFGDQVTSDITNEYNVPAGFERKEYQIDAVAEGFRKLMRYDGFFLADVVGLGKTVIATMIARKFILANGSNTRILVVFPPTLKSNWHRAFDSFKIKRYATFISNGSLDNILNLDKLDKTAYDSADTYDLVIIDESHKFRNRKTKRYEQLQKICKFPRRDGGMVEGLRKKVILISATPQNNSPEDIYNQILLFQDEHNPTLEGITDLKSYFQPIIKKYQQIKSTDSTDNGNAELRSLGTQLRDHVIKPITIRRTRTDIMSIERYKSEAKEFPTVVPPKKIAYNLSDTQTELFNRTIDALVNENKLSYAYYQAIGHLKNDVQEKMGYEKAEHASRTLVSIKKTMLVKRLESSFESFKISLTHFINVNQKMIEMFENDKVYIAPDLNISKMLVDGCKDEEIEEKLQEAYKKNKKSAIFKQNDFKVGFIDKLRKDQKILNELSNEWSNEKCDPKLDVFLKLLDSELFDPQINVGQKLVIFSEYADTVDYLKEQIKRKDLIHVKAENRDKLQKTIEENFDENFKETETQTKKNDYNILLTTDVLAEGVNLHRSNVIVNYDTPWNATRLMQRIGRVNRIGTKAKNIYNYVFYPSQVGDKQIHLVRHSVTRLQAFHSTYGEDNQIYSQNEVVETLDQLFDATIEHEEPNEELLFLEEIRNLKERNDKLFKRIQSLNLRSRSGRARRDVKGKTLSKSSLVFVKSGGRKAFYLADNATTEELTSLEALNFFKAEPEEPRMPLIPEHHEQVEQAFQTFDKAVQQSRIETQGKRESGKQTNKAIRCVKEVAKKTEDANEKEKLDILVRLIESGTIASLEDVVLKMGKKTPKLAEMLEGLIALANEYEPFDPKEIMKRQTIAPSVIILSETFN